MPPISAGQMFVAGALIVCAVISFAAACYLSYSERKKEDKTRKARQELQKKNAKNRV